MPHQTLARSGASTNCPKTLGRAPWSREHRCARPAQQRAAESKSSEQHRQAARQRHGHRIYERIVDQPIAGIDGDSGLQRERIARELEAATEVGLGCPHAPRCIVHTLIDVAMVPDTAASIRRPAFASGVKHDDAIGCF